MYICLLLPLLCFVSKYRCHFNPARSTVRATLSFLSVDDFSLKRKLDHNTVLSPQQGLFSLQLQLNGT